MDNQRPEVVRDGKVAVQHRTTNPITVQIDGTERSYSFVPLHNVSLAWVEKQDLEKILSIQMKACECDGGRKTARFYLASETNVRIHETGSY